MSPHEFELPTIGVGCVSIPDDHEVVGISPDDHLNIISINLRWIRVEVLCWECPVGRSSSCEDAVVPCLDEHSLSNTIPYEISFKLLPSGMDSSTAVQSISPPLSLSVLIISRSAIRVTFVPLYVSTSKGRCERRRILVS